MMNPAFIYTGRQSSLRLINIWYSSGIHNAVPIGRRWHAKSAKHNTQSRGWFVEYHLRPESVLIEKQVVTNYLQEKTY